MGVAHFRRDLRLRVDWPEFGGVGVDCTELVFAESVFVASDMIDLNSAANCSCGWERPCLLCPQHLGSPPTPMDLTATEGGFRSVQTSQADASGQARKTSSKSAQTHTYLASSALIYRVDYILQVLRRSDNRAKELISSAALKILIGAHLETLGKQPHVSALSFARVLIWGRRVGEFVILSEPLLQFRSSIGPGSKYANFRQDSDGKDHHPRGGSV